MKIRKIYLTVILAVIIISLISVMLFCKIEYYQNLPFEIKDKNVYVSLKNVPERVYLNINHEVYEIKKWALISNDIYVLDFSITKTYNDKVFVYMKTYELNYMCYIFKIVFNI